jgi:hypothetical protein
LFLTYIFDGSVDFFHAGLAILLGPGEKCKGLLVILGEVLTFWLLLIDLDV